MYITFGSYLDGLKAEQGQLPPDRRREVPTIRDLAKSVGVHEVTLTNISRGNIKHLDLEKARRILDEMRRRGFKADLTDFLKYVPPEHEI